MLERTLFAALFYVALAALSMDGCKAAQRTASGAPLDKEREIVAAATRCGGQGKVESGPRAEAGKAIAIVAEDLRNGGILGASQGIREAASAIGWTVKVFDLGGMIANRARVMDEVLAFKPDAIALMGGLTLEGSKGYGGYDFTPASQRGVRLVGWHAHPWPGPIPGTPVSVNVSTDPLLVARMAASKAIVESEGRAGVVIFTDSKIGLALTKSNAMADVIRACQGCELLETVDVGLEETGARMPGVTRSLLEKHGKRWTHALAINDIYFDYMVPTLITAKLGSHDLRLISGGDGSPSAFLRIGAASFQTATAAEPLNLQGWQLVDELNRLFANQPLSGFIALPRLVAGENMKCDGAPRRLYDPDNGYRDSYRRIWGR